MRWASDHWPLAAWLLALSFAAGGLWFEVQSMAGEKDVLREINTRLSRIEGHLGVHSYPMRP